jgi:hypothetical protein
MRKQQCGTECIIEVPIEGLGVENDVDLVEHIPKGRNFRIESLPRQGFERVGGAWSGLRFKADGDMGLLPTGPRLPRSDIGHACGRSGTFGGRCGGELLSQLKEAEGGCDCIRLSRLNEVDHHKSLALAGQLSVISVEAEAGREGKVDQRRDSEGQEKSQHQDSPTWKPTAPVRLFRSWLSHY